MLCTETLCTLLFASLMNLLTVSKSTFKKFLFFQLDLVHLWHIVNCCVLEMSVAIILCPPGGRLYVCLSALAVCLFVCWQLYIKTAERIFMKILPQMYLWTTGRGRTDYILEVIRLRIRNPDPGIFWRILCEIGHFATIGLISPQRVIGFSWNFITCILGQGSNPDPETVSTLDSERSPWLCCSCTGISWTV